jgi:DNA-binding response OmpR family regulator
MNETIEPRPKLLIVEDDDATALALRVMFHQRTGWGALVAATLAEARSLLEERPNAVLLDLMLPDGCGEDLIDEIRDRCPGCRIVIVTALPEGGPRVARIAEERSPDRIVHKPYDIDELIAAVKGPNPLVPSP